VTVSDPWVEAIQPRVEPLKGELREMLAEAGVAVPVNVSSWGRFLASLGDLERQSFECVLTAREEQKADVPWSDEAAKVDDLAKALDAEEEHDGSVEMALDLAEARAEG
jgi:hypothetical protein